MMDQYKKETSQVHAPAELIRKTKEAMREEEQRLIRERLQQEVIVKPRRSYGKVYQWALPVAAAAAVCVMLFSVSVMRLGSGTGKMQSDTSMDKALGVAEEGNSGMQFGAADMAEEMEVASEEPIDKGGSQYDMAAGVAATTENSVNQDATSDNGMYTDAEVQSESNSYIDSIYGNNDLWIEEVKKIPLFYDAPNTECIAVKGIELYVGKDSDGAWIAYVQVDGNMYVISTVLTDEVISREEFADKAYELLVEERII